ncbi:uncharacterized protein I206_100064 [Kwoniella pini CBS 10737]|uniref:PinX1-related protein 1 n=1 Tax=Kwoniella pini CBS 10737 TaxID=1296096 RepID=A0A1B9HSI5_9TREE|nr:uncharacterized protein I206_07879 [Kwoniella pini CBS 10737]OCF46208.1 hypothetical protein I206_07879 [Kwoniella pini CBS 10737]
MGLSQRKEKQRIGLDPRNLSWSDDKSRFSYKHMTALGWTDNSGLGAGLAGNPNHIAVVRKSDQGGIGMDRARKDGSDLAAGAGQAGRGLEDVLKRIAAASASPSPSPAPETPTEEKKVEQKIMRNRIASRQKHLNMKRMASQSPAALAEILGVPISSLPSSPPPSSTPQPESPGESSSFGLGANKENERNSDETVTKSTLSVSDYFRQKMREKMAARQANSEASGSISKINVEELPSSSLERIPDVGSSSKPIGGTAWEGQKVAFEDVQVEFDPSSEPVRQPVETEKKKKDKKSKKEKTKEGEDPIHAAAEHVHQFEHAGEVEDEKARKKQEKEEKKRKKEEKKAQKVEGAEKEKDKKRKREVEEDDEVKVKKDKKDKKDKGEKKKEKKDKKSA